jgi:hypothetical protein
MNHWAFILAAYGVALGGTGTLLLTSLIAMWRAERR